MKKADIEREMQLAEMMASDIDKLYKKYAKAALQAEWERIEKVRVEKFKDCSTVQELQDLYGWDVITIDEYEAGRHFLEEKEKRIKQLSLVEKHRANLKEIRDRWKGTIKELQEELDELNGVEKVKPMNAFEKLDEEWQNERLDALKLQDALGR